MNSLAFLAGRFEISLCGETTIRISNRGCQTTQIPDVYTYNDCTYKKIILAFTWNRYHNSSIEPISRF